MLSYKYPGVILTIESQREYLIPKSISLSHILGYLGKINNEDIKKNNNYDGTDSVGKIGLEYEYESFLMGSKGREQIEVDAIGKEIKKIADIQPIAGNNLILTIDSDIQSKLEELLSKALEKTKKTKGVAIAMDPMNGEILALVSLPGFDNNIFSKGISQEELQKILSDESRPLYNRSIYGLYPSGSTIKPVIAAAALQEGVITQWTQINSVGGIRINQWYFPDWKIGGHGLTNIKKALAESVNSFFYYIGGGYEQFEGLGLDKLLSNFRLAGIGSQTGIDLPGESEGLIPTKEWKEEVKKESWYIGDTYHLSIGQGDLLVTPLQVANWTSMISNGGILYQPRLVLKIIDNNNKIIKKIEPAVLQKNAFSEENLDIVKQGLRDTIVYGSARSLSDLPIKVAGKTGSAEWSSKKPTHAWFTSFAPYPDPKIVVTILIEEGGEGSSVAAPVAKEFYLWWSQNKFFMDK
ncbi:MAG: Peptidoglycan glycosyltransferase [Parcubacteria group bacterium GW2011_GWA2_38_13]|nr:MAG: Peptidoglycan glycosyltransferase [Parcubacteria group bacterium GW2011_GWA2_38_13]